MDLRELDLEGVDWIHLAYDRARQWTIVNMVMSLQVPLKAGNFWTESTISFSRTLLCGVKRCKLCNISQCTIHK
jgi:hypothetical protein